MQDSSRQVRDNYHQAVAGDADYRPPTAIGAAQGLPGANNPITGIGTGGDDEGDP